MNDATDFGIALRELKARNNLSEGRLAEKLKVAPGTLSNYITGNNIPEMKFLAKCIEQFGQKKIDNERGIDIADFFYKAFLSAAKNNHRVIVDTRFIDSKRIEMLAKILTILTLYPQLPLSENKYKVIQELEQKINGYFNDLEKIAVFHPPAD